MKKGHVTYIGLIASFATRKKLLGSLFIVLLSFIFIELALRIIGVTPVHIFNMKITPESFIQPDSSLGWVNKPGNYNAYINDSLKLFNVTVDSNGSRLTIIDKCSFNDKVINIYGCSVTFGLSVEDSQTQSFYLQELTPEIKICNRGVPAYGLAQIYNLINKDIIEKKLKPDYAIINYSDFHDIRSGEHLYWSSMIKHAISNGKYNQNFSLKLPFYTLENDTLLKYNQKSMTELTDFFRFSHCSATVATINNVYFDMKDRQKDEYFSEISLLTIKKIADLCLKNDIIPIFGYLVNSVDRGPNYKIHNELNKMGIHAFVYSIDYGEFQYNNSPHDSGHPNAVANKIFSEDLYGYLKSSKFGF